MSSIRKDRSRFLARLFGAAGVLLFVGAFFAAPLAHALMLCSMPCCLPGAGVTKIVPTTTQPCGAQECTISALEATIPVATAAVTSSPAAIINIDVVRADDAVAHDAAGIALDLPPHGASAPIHVLNSTFRI